MAVETRHQPDSVAYGFPIALAGLVLVITYVIAGLAKLRYGGLDWVFGDTLRNHVAYAAARLDLLGGSPSPLAGWAVRLDGIWPFVAAATIVVELGAPVALRGGRLRTAWVLAAWLMHLGVLVFMSIGFPFPLFLVAFAPLYRVERLWIDRPSWLRRSSGQRAATSRLGESVTPGRRSVVLVGFEVVRLVDEEALALDDEVEAVRTQALRDPLRGLAREQRRRVDAGVECSGEASGTDVVGQVVEPVAQTLAVGVGVEFQVVVFRCHVRGAGSTPPARHAMRVRRPADDDEICRRELLGRRVVDGEDRRLGECFDPFGNVLGDRMRVAEHRLVHHQRAHRDLLIIGHIRVPTRSCPHRTAMRTGPWSSLPATVTRRAMSETPVFGRFAHRGERGSSLR